MPDYATASRTKDHFQDELFRNHPEIVSIAPQLKLDDMGHPTQEGVIVIGVASVNTRLSGPQPSAPSPAQPIPTSLTAVGPNGRLIAGAEVPVVVEYTGKVVPHMNVARMRPCPGGFSVGHIRVTAGTLGGNFRIGANYGFILSCNHVLAAVNSAAVGDPIVQPGAIDGGTDPADRIAQLTRFVPIDLTGADNEVDCALAKELTSGNISRNVQSIGIPNDTADGTTGQAVRKSGRTTQLTQGTILSDNASLIVGYGPGGTAPTGKFVNQLKCTLMSQGGDSGSLIWDLNDLIVVGMVFAGDAANTYGNKILRVLALLAQAITVYDLKGNVTRFPKAEIDLVDPPRPAAARKPRKSPRRRTKTPV